MPSNNPPQWPDRTARTAHLILHGWEPGQYLGGGLCIARGDRMLYLKKNLEVAATGIGGLERFPADSERDRWDRMHDHAFWALARAAEVWGNDGQQ